MRAVKFKNHNIGMYKRYKIHTERERESDREAEKRWEKMKCDWNGLWWSRWNIFLFSSRTYKIDHITSEYVEQKKKIFFFLTILGNVVTCFIAFKWNLADTNQLFSNTVCPSLISFTNSVASLWLCMFYILNIEM